MKRLFIAAIAITASTISYAQETSQPAKTTPVATEKREAAPAPAADQKQEERTPVKVSDLPAPVSKQLGNTQYKDWTPTVAYWVKDGKSSYYEITLVKGDKSKRVKYNAEGSKLD